jgi:hypothetical protein
MYYKNKNYRKNKNIKKHHKKHKHKHNINHNNKHQVHQEYIPNHNHFNYTNNEVSENKYIPKYWQFNNPEIIGNKYGTKNYLQKHKQDDIERDIYLFGFRHNIRAKCFYKWFKKFGEIEKIFPVNQYNMPSCKYLFIRYFSKEASQEAIKHMDNTQFYNRIISVSKRLPKGQKMQKEFIEEEQMSNSVQEINSDDSIYVKQNNPMVNSYYKIVKESSSLKENEKGKKQIKHLTQEKLKNKKINLRNNKEIQNIDIYKSIEKEKNSNNSSICTTLLRKRRNLNQKPIMVQSSVGTERMSDNKRVKFLSYILETIKTKQKNDLKET